MQTLPLHLTMNPDHDSGPDSAPGDAPDSAPDVARREGPALVDADPDCDPEAPPGPGPDDVRMAVVAHSDGRIECTIFPVGVDEFELMTTWVTADIDSVAALDDMR